MREKFGSAKGGERTDLHESSSESERSWSSQKTADKLGFGRASVSEAKTATTFCQTDENYRLTDEMKNLLSVF